MTTSENNKKQREENFTCRHCGNKTSHLLLYSHTIPESMGINPYDNEELFIDYYYFLFECKTCKGISLKGIFEEEIEYPPSRDMSFEDIHYFYPSSKKFNQEVPKGLR